ncbi:MAG: hypothetical protein WC780_08160 [Lentimicrobiaceae bacterium]
MNFKTFFFIPRSEKYTQIEVYSFIAISLLLFLFLLLRAIVVPMTHDEIVSFYMYAQTGDFRPFIDHTDGNNHLLNSFLTFISYHVFGSSPFALRLPNLLFSLLYFYFCFRLSETLRSKFLGWTFFLTMALTLHFIEFHALSRGYGLSATFLVGALWQIVSGIRSRNSGRLYLGFLFIFLSSVAILSLMYTYGLMVGYIVVFMILNFKQFGKVDVFKFIAFGILPLLFLVTFSIFIKSNGAYFDGNKVDFWKSTFVSLFMGLGDLDFVEIKYMLMALSISLLIPFLFLLFRILRHGKEAVTYHLLFPYLLLGNAALTYLGAKMMDLSFPADRMAFYFYPLIVGSIVFLLDTAISSSRLNFLLFLVIPLAYFPIHFVKAVNFEYSVWYKYSHIPPRFYREVMDGYKSGEIPPSVTAHPLQAFAWNYLIRLNDNKASLISKVPWPPSFRTQYLIIELQDNKNWQQLYDTIDYDQISNKYLLQAKTSFNWLNLYSRQNISTDGVTSNEYFTLYEVEAEKFKGRPIEIGFDLTIQSYKSLIYGGIVISINDSSGKNLVWEPRFLHWTQETWDGKPHNFLDRFVLDMPKEASKLSIYFWNIKKVDFSVNGGKISISELKPELENQLNVLD